MGHRGQKPAPKRHGTKHELSTPPAGPVRWLISDRAHFLNHVVVVVRTVYSVWKRAGLQDVEGAGLAFSGVTVALAPEAKSRFRRLRSG